MVKYVDEVVAKIGDTGKPKPVKIDKYVLLTNDNELFVEGMRPQEIQKLIYKLSKILYEQAIVAEYSFRKSDDAGDPYEDITADTTTISAIAMSYAGELCGETLE